MQLSEMHGTGRVKKTGKQSLFACYIPAYELDMAIYWFPSDRN